MSLYDKLIQLYPTLTLGDFNPFSGTIMLQNDSDGRGDYILKWNHPTINKPNDDEIKG